MTKARKNLYQEVTDNIIAALEDGVAPWVKPWDAKQGLPCNQASGRPYRGINIPILWTSAMNKGFASDRWMTFRQANQSGGSVKKDSKGTTVVFWKQMELADETACGQTEDKADQPRRIPMMRAFTVFNEEQISGISSEETTSPPSWEPNEEAERFMSRACIKHGGPRAFYSPDRDVIQLPPRDSFQDAASYHATALHELIHWTGHQSRLDRLKKTSFGSPDYAKEELTAEMGAAFLTASLGIQGNLQHPEYIASWLKALREDNRAIFRAASAGQAAVDFITREE